MNKRTTITYSTLKDWRNNIQNDPDWRPNHRRPKYRAFDDTAEQAIVQQIQSQIDTLQFISIKKVRQIMRTYINNNPTSLLVPVAKMRYSRHFIQCFLDRHKLALRKYHTQHRPLPKLNLIDATSPQ